MKKCPCHSNLEYSNCCGPLHLGAIPKSALNLMRSRFSAYSLGLVDYIINTTHTKSIHYNIDLESWKRQIIEFSTNTDFNNLIIIEYLSIPEETVTFTASLLQNNEDESFTEKSIFKKENGVLKYYEALFL